MKYIVKEFCRRGIIACGLGPIALAVLYLVLKHSGTVEVLTIDAVCIGIFSLATLAFISGGMNVIYQIERLPLMAAISIHGGVLYVSYLLTYLANDWLDWGPAPILVFTGIFVVGYLLIWAIIYTLIKRNTKRINEVLKKSRKGQ